MKTVFYRNKLWVLKMIFLLIMIMVLYYAGNGQTRLSGVNSKGGFRYMRLQGDIAGNASVENIKLALDIAPGNELQLLKSSTSYGVTHHKYQQYVDGIRIKGAVFFVHSKNNHITTVNGKWIEGFNAEAVPRMSEKEAVQRALDICKAMGQEPLSADKVRNIFGTGKDKDKGGLPHGDLIWYGSDNNAAKYVLAYEVDVYTSKPFAKYRTYIDAGTGQLLHRFDVLHHDNIQGRGTTNYYGQVNITVDSVNASEYRLSVDKYGGHTSYKTFDISNFDNAKVVSDKNNIWGEAGEEYDRAAVDAHWGIGLTLDYFYQYHGRKGMDNKGSDVSVNVHIKDENGNSMANAFYDSGSVYFGDGDGEVITKPFTALAIVAHEFAHGVTESEANLVYEGESGAINESMSDIFGVTVEYFMNDGNYDWKLGKELGYTFRVMNDPNSREMPATYKGKYWVDAADVHINSAIGNLWYALLVDGGSGTNDLGNNYEVQGIGFERASKIVYEVLTNYLTPESDYAGFRATTIEAATQLYGRCSEEYTAVTDAWYAVGIGETSHDNDLALDGLESPATACRLGVETVAVDIVFNSCRDTFQPGTSFDIFYTVNDADTVKEVVTINDSLNAGDVYHFEFAKPVDMTKVDTYRIKVWMEREEDGYLPNNVLNMTVVNKLDQNQDFAVNSIMDLPPFFCDNVLDKGVKTVLQFNGCDSITKGNTVPLEIGIGSKIYNEQFVLKRTLYSGDTVHYALQGDYVLPDYGDIDLSVTVKFPGDPFSSNNNIISRFRYSPSLTTELLVPYDSKQEFDNFDIAKGELVAVDSISGPFLHQRTDTGTRNTDILFTGGLFVTNLGELKYERPASADDVWNVNKKFISRMCKCVDAQDWDSVFVSFDFAINTNFALHLYLGDPEPTLYSNMRLTIDGEPVTGTYHSQLDDELNVVYRKELLDLSEYAGASFNLCFELQNVFPGFILMPDSLFMPGDDIELDNIYIGPKNIVSTGEITLENGLDIEVYPSPAHDYAKVSLHNLKANELHWTLYDMNGQRMMIKSLSNNKSNEFVIDMSHLKPGMYYLKIQNAEYVKVLSLLKM